jgi:guanosine-3',5'-bis(diphosphate) 3'-pyrophosphohydrolase
MTNPSEEGGQSMQTVFSAEEVSQLLKAVKFAADKHRDQRRKGADESPYINHPLNVAETLWRVGGVRDLSIIVAAVLHDTIEYTKTSPEEIEELFGSSVRSLVEEVTDNKSLPKPERKRLQVEHAPHLSAGAKQIKLADKTANISDVAFAPPPDWPLERRLEYLVWAETVVAGLRGCNAKLEGHFDSTLEEAKTAVGT